MRSFASQRAPVSGNDRLPAACEGFRKGVGRIGIEGDVGLGDRISDFDADRSAQVRSAEA